jgi:hypothetical protein
MIGRRESKGSTATQSTSPGEGQRRRDGNRAPTASEAVERQRADFGGIKWGSAFFGWLVATGVAALLTALLSATGAATGLTKVNPAQASAQAKTIGIAGGIALLVMLMIAYYAGGYVAARMARLDGARQGAGVWIVGLIVTIVLALAGAVLGAKYNLLAGLNLPRIPVSEGTLTAAGLIALLAIALGTLLSAVIGGKVGTRYHRRLDRAVHRS